MQVDAVEYFFIDLVLHLCNFLRGHCREVCKVEANPVLVHKLARLVDMLAQHIPQCGLQQMCGRMVAHDRASPGFVHMRDGLVADRKAAHRHLADVQKMPRA